MEGERRRMRRRKERVVRDSEIRDSGE